MAFDWNGTLAMGCRGVEKTGSTGGACGQKCRSSGMCHLQLRRTEQSPRVGLVGVEVAPKPQPRVRPSALRSPRGKRAEDGAEP